MATPSLSIIVPIYDVEKYLRQCLDSLVNQTLEDIEIIIVNDCSPDNSEAIIEEYLLKDARIIYIKHEQNLGLGGARNTGIQAAHGQYITFVDSDDYVDTGLFETAVQAFIDYEIDLVILPFRSFFCSGNEIKSSYKSIEGIYQVTLDNLLEYTFFSAWSKVYRRKDIIAHNFLFLEHLYWEDIPFWTEICADMQPLVINLSEKTGIYWYRQRDSSISGRAGKTYTSLPKALLYTYHALSNRSTLLEFYKGFYRIVSGQMIHAWTILDKSCKFEFVENFSEFIQGTFCTEAEKKLVPEWFLMTKLESPESKVSLIDYYIEKTEQAQEFISNPWYKFEKMNRKEKLLKIFGSIGKKFLRLLGLSRILHLDHLKTSRNRIEHRNNSDVVISDEMIVGKPLLSIVVPVYNVEKYLRQCLDSLVNQTFKNIEIIIVDDCSPDNSALIIQEYAARDSRIISIKHEDNLSLGAARNTGIKAARGKYISFVDSDDYLDLNLYQVALEAFKKHNIGLVLFPYKIFYEGKTGIQIVHPCHKKPYKIEAGHFSLDFSFVSATIKIYTLKDLTNYDIKFPVGLHWEDMGFWVEYSTIVEPIAFNLPKDGPGYWYRKHEQSITGQNTKTYSTQPKIFTYIIHVLHRQGKLDMFCAQLCYLISLHTCAVWKFLDKSYLPQFAENFSNFINELLLMSPVDVLPREWVLMREVQSTEGKMLFVETYVKNFSLQEKISNSRWYQFGKMSGKQKIVKVLKVASKRVLKLAGLEKVSHFMRTKIKKT